MVLVKAKPLTTSCSVFVSGLSCSSFALQHSSLYHTISSHLSKKRLRPGLVEVFSCDRVYFVDCLK